MREEDFKIQNIYTFSPAEVRGTGAHLDDIQLPLLLALHRFRKTLRRRVVLLPNGMTTGEHTAPEHRLGLAADIAFIEADGKVLVEYIFKAALTAGIKGIGIYWNGSAYSVHLDLRGSFAFWSAVKKHRENNWIYAGLIIDPKGD